MLDFEGFAISLQEVTDGFKADIVGHFTKFSKFGKSHIEVIQESKLECLKVLAEESFQSCFIVEQKTGKIIYKNIPLLDRQFILSGFELQDYREGVAFVKGLENEKPVTIAIAVIDYGNYLRCQIESIKYDLIHSTNHQ